jgi:hypothetical protein
LIPLLTALIAVALIALLPFASGRAVAVVLVSLTLLPAALAALTLVPLPLCALILLIALPLILLLSH